MKVFSYIFISGAILLGFSSVSCKKESIGLPDNLISTKPDSVLIAKQTALFVEGSSVLSNHPILFSQDPTTEKRVIMKNDGMVYVTFLSEGAAWTNSLGYYTYPSSGEPSKANMQILFPNISGDGEGGGLKPGDLVQVGSGIIPKGTVVGFYLVAQGWKNGKLVSGAYTNFTDKIYNLNQAQLSILYVEKTTGKLVLGFEDTQPGNAWNDMDCNDVVISISDSKEPTSIPTSIDLSLVPVL